MKQFVLGALAAMLAIALSSCQQPDESGTTGSGGSRASGRGGSATLMTINGRPVTGEELLKSGHMRQALREYIFYESMRNEAQKAGVKVDEAEFNKRMEENKRNVQEQMGISWEEFLKQMGQNEKDYSDNARQTMLFEALADAKIDVTEEEMQAVWETDKESLVSMYIHENHLPDTDRANVTFEQVKDLARERVKMNKGQMEQGRLIAGIVMNAEVDLVGIRDPGEQQLMEDLILNHQKEQAAAQLEQMEAQEAAMSGEAAPEASPTVEDMPTAEMQPTATPEVTPEDGDDATEPESGE